MEAFRGTDRQRHGFCIGSKRKGIIMKKQRKISKKKVLLIIVCALFLIAAGLVLSNHLFSDFSDLNKTDKQILSELDEYVGETEKEDVWAGYDLGSKTILVMNTDSGKAYMISSESPVKSIFAKEISMPKDSHIKVYRLSYLTPQLLPIRVTGGNFNTAGETYEVLGKEVYYTKYDEEDSINSKYSSRHYITFLTHEAFHYYMQNDWKGGYRFTGELSEKDIELLGSEYDVLGQIQDELKKDEPSKDALHSYAADYVDIMRQRIKADPKYVESELSMETAEGTAQYVSIKASDIVGYDFGVMYFDNVKEVPFSEVIPALKAKKIKKAFLADRMPYETGALLCQLLEELDVKGWQERLNEQTKDEPVTIFSEIEAYISG